MQIQFNMLPEVREYFYAAQVADTMRQKFFDEDPEIDFHDIEYYDDKEYDAMYYLFQYFGFTEIPDIRYQ